MSSRPPAKAELEAVADRVHSAAIHLLRRLRKVDDASGMAGPRLSALSVLVFAGPMSLKALAAAEQVRPPSMSRVVSELAVAGLVRCEADASDKRSIRISATSAGRRRLLKGRARRLETLAALLAGMTTEELGRLDRAIGSIERVLRMPPCKS